MGVVNGAPYDAGLEWRGKYFGQDGAGADGKSWHVGMR